MIFEPAPVCGRCREPSGTVWVGAARWHLLSQSPARLAGPTRAAHALGRCREPSGTCRVKVRLGSPDLLHAVIDSYDFLVETPEAMRHHALGATRLFPGLRLTMKRLLALTSASLILWTVPTAAQSADVFAKGEGVSLERAIPANERGILCLTTDEKDRIYGGTTGRAAHLFRFDPQTNEVRSLARLDGGVGFAYQLIRLPDGSFIGGTQADPTGIAARTDPRAVGRLYPEYQRNHRQYLAGRSSVRLLVADTKVYRSGSDRGVSHV